MIGCLRTHVRKQPIIALYVSASSQSLRFILSLRMNSSFKTSRPGRPTLNVILRWDSCPVESLLVCRRPRVISAVKLLYFISSSREFVQSYRKDINFYYFATLDDVTLMEIYRKYQTV